MDAVLPRLSAYSPAGGGGVEKKDGLVGRGGGATG